MYVKRVFALLVALVIVTAIAVFAVDGRDSYQEYKTGMSSHGGYLTDATFASGQGGGVTVMPALARYDTSVRDYTIMSFAGGGVFISSGTFNM